MTFETSRADWLSLDEAVGRVLAAAEPLSTETVPLQEALGRALAAPVRARATLPPWDNSAMDGYAVRGEDVAGATEAHPVRLRVLGSAPAGAAFKGSVGPGEAVRIMTGGPVPQGADSVVRVEDTDGGAGDEGWVAIRSGRDRQRHVRPGGQDMREGDVLLTEGTSVGPGQVAMAAAAGLDTLVVRRRPRIAVLSSGDELRGPGDFSDVSEGRGIPETNGPTLAAAVAACGGTPLLLGIARDEPGHIREKVAQAADADALVTSGGASMGEADLFKRTLREDGLKLDFWRVRIRPGSPFSLARLPGRGGRGDLPVLGLPGNPASAFVTFQLFVRPFLLRMAGHSRVHRRWLDARAAERLVSTRDLCHFLRVRVENGADGLEARLTGHQGSGLVQSLGRAHGLAVIPAGTRAVEAGEAVRVILLDDVPAASDTPGYTTAQP